MRDCGDFREWISRSFDRRLAAPDMDELALHLAACPACRHAHERMDQADSVLRRHGRVELPARFEERVLARVPEAAQLERNTRLVRSSLVGAAAVALFGVGVWLGLSPGRQPDHDLVRRKAARDLTAMESLVQVTEAFSGLDPVVELEVARHMADALNVRALRRDLKLETLRDIPGGQQLALYVESTEPLLRGLDDGDLNVVRLEARRLAHARDVPKLQETLQVKFETPRVDPNAMSGPVSQDVRYVVKGGLALATRRYDDAIHSLGKAVDSQTLARTARVLRVNAYKGSGQVEDAVRDCYVVALTAPAAEAEWSRTFAARNFKALASRGQFYLDRVPAAGESEEALARMFTGSKPSLAYRQPETRDWVCVVAEGSEAGRAFWSLKSKVSSVRLTFEGGVATARLNPADVRMRLAKEELESLSRIPAFNVMLGAAQE